MKTLTLAAAATFLGLSLTASIAHDYKLGALEIGHPHARATPPNAPVSGGYLTIRNTGDAADRLIGVKAGFADRVEIHEMSMENDVMKMREVTDGLEIPAGGEVELKPGGYHIMFIGLDSRMAEGETRTATLSFEKTGSIEVDFSVENIIKIKERMSKDGHADMDHGDGGHGGMKHGG